MLNGAWETRSDEQAVEILETVLAGTILVLETNVRQRDKSGGVREQVGGRNDDFKRKQIDAHHPSARGDSS